MLRIIEDLAIDRREMIRRLSVALGAVTAIPEMNGFSADRLLAESEAIHKHISREAASDAWKPLVFDAHQSETVDVISELIIPQTKTPGAKATKVTQFIDLLLTNVPSRMKEDLLAGLVWIDKRSQDLFQKDFIRATPQQQIELLTNISAPDSQEEAAGKTFFRQIKAATVFGYYTSQEGMEQELGYQGPMTPGTYEGCTHSEHRA